MTGDQRASSAGFSVPARLGGALLAALVLAALLAAPALASKSHNFLETFGSAAKPSFANDRALAVDQSTGDLLVTDLGQTEEQKLEVAKATGGTYVLSFDPDGAGPQSPQSTSALAYNATNTAIQTALRALPAIGSTGVTVANVGGAGTDTLRTRNITFAGPLAKTDVAQITTNPSGLSCTEPLPGCPAQATITTTTPGVVTGIKRFHSDGTPANFSALGTNVIDAKGAGNCATVPADCDQTPENGLTGFAATEEARQVQIAIDESGGVTDGNIYVDQPKNKRIDIFAADGHYLGQLTATGATAFAGEACGVAIDSTGAVYVSTKGTNMVNKFVPVANPPVNANFTTSFGVGDGTLAPCTLAAGVGPTAGFLFVNLRSGNLFKVNSSTGETKYQIGTSESNAGVTVDPATGHVYLPVGAGSGVFSPEVVEYDATGATEATRVASFSAASGVEGIAVNETTGKVYVSRASSPTDDVFGPIVVAPDLTIAAATGVTGAHASLSGTVDPDGKAITECKFEYGTTTSYGSSQPCTGAIPTDTSSHEVTAALGGLLANGTTYHYRIVAKNADGTAVSGDKTFATANTYFTNAASAVVDTKATLNGTLKREGVTLTDCKFEYGLTVSYGASAPCSPLFSAIPDDGESHGVSAAVSGLLSNARYHFRLVAITAAGSIVGTDQTFTTNGPPLIAEQVASVGSGTATLQGYVNPGGAAATYRFEWGSDSSYGTQIPAEFELFVGAGNSPVKVSAKVSGVTQGFTYHYRIVASNEFGTSQGPDQTFTVTPANSSCPNGALRLGQVSETNPDGTAYLPDCMGLELVSPPKKYNQKAEGPTFSASGDTVSFLSIAALAETPQVGSVFGDPYIATRGPSGWTARPTSPPASLGYNPPCSFTPDLSRWTVQPRPAGLTPGFAPYIGDLSGSFIPLGPALQPLNVIPDNAMYCRGGSIDATHGFFESRAGAYLPGDPVPPQSGGAIGSTYESYLNGEGEPTTELLARDEDGKVWGGACGTTIGFRGTGNSRATRGAISPDASRVYFSTRPGQAGVGACESGNGIRVMERLRTPSGPVISELVSVGECTRVSPPCSTAAGDDNFRVANQEGDKVYFTSTRQLADSDLDTGTQCDVGVGSSAGCDLYLYDASRPAGSRLTQISAGDATDPTPGKGAEVLGVPDVAGDGSHAYFVATGVLTTTPNARGLRPETGKPNLYLYERDSAHPAGRTSFIATLDSGDASVWGGSSQGYGPGFTDARAVPLLGANPEDLSVGGDGHVLVFPTKASLVLGDTDGGKKDIYRYDSRTGSLERISAAAPGGSDNGPFDVSIRPSPKEDSVFPQQMFFPRWVSDDGRSIVFSTSEGLYPADTDGLPTVYVWHDGKVTALLGSRGDLEPGMSASGDIAFVSSERLLSEDGDGARDVYVARIDGGFPPPVEPVLCQGEACQGAPSPQPGDQGAASESVSGAGNVKPKAERAKTCPSGKHKVRRKGKVRCVKAQQKRRHNRAHERDANANRRAGK